VPSESDDLQAAFRRLRPSGLAEWTPERLPPAEVAPPLGPDGTAPPAPARPRWRSRLRRLLDTPQSPSPPPAPPPSADPEPPGQARAGIHQFVPNLHAGDAVGRHTQRLRDTIRARGIPSRIYVQAAEAATAAETELFTSYPGASHPGDVLLYQFATASDLVPWLVARPETLVVNYHNVTPPELYAPWDPDVARIQQRARGELGVMAPRTTLAIADSSFNVSDLTAAGYGVTAVVPPIAAINVGVGPAGAHAAGAAPPPARRVPRGRGARWLCVGRLAPNKAVEDALMALVVTRERHDPAATLTVVGKEAQPAYSQALYRFAADMGLEQAVTFVGHVSDDEVAAAFAAADLLVVPSVHEGFCVPLVEAMAVGLPVVASESGVSLDILGGAGVMVDTHHAETLATAIADLLGDEARYDALVAAGRHQLEVLELDRAGDRIVDLVLGLDGPDGPSHQ
jgi:glycosyltransferase involved in cell wall biosynthesis